MLGLLVDGLVGLLDSTSFSVCSQFSVQGTVAGMPKAIGYILYLNYCIYLDYCIISAESLVT